MSPSLQTTPLPNPTTTTTLPGVILIEVKGTPRPQPRPRFVRGRVISTADANAKRWIAAVEAASRVSLAEHGKQAGPLAVLMSFHFPTADASRHGLPHTSRPDADNLAKLALDSLMRAGLIADDAAVSCLTARKSWSHASQAGVAITVAPDRRARLPCPENPPAWLQAGASGSGGCPTPPG